MRKTKVHIRRFLRSDRAVLLACIGIAACFWLGAKLSRTYQIEQPFKTTYILPLQKTLATKPPTIINCKLEGAGWRLLRFRWFSNSTLLLPLADVPEQTISRTVIKSAVAAMLPSNVHILDTEYDFIKISIEDEVSKKVPVAFSHAISCRQGYRTVGEPAVSPDSVTITAPRSWIEKISVWHTQPLALSQADKNIAALLPLQQSDWEQIVIAPARVQVNWRVEQFTAKTFTLPIQVKNATPAVAAFSLHPATVQLQCSVSLSDYARLDTADFRLEVDATQLRQRTAGQSVRVDVSKLPASVSDVSYFPKMVEVKW